MAHFHTRRKGNLTKRPLAKLAQLAVFAWLLGADRPHGVNLIRVTHGCGTVDHWFVVIVVVVLLVVFTPTTAPRRRERTRSRQSDPALNGELVFPVKAVVGLGIGTRGRGDSRRHTGPRNHNRTRFDRNAPRRRHIITETAVARMLGRTTLFGNVGGVAGIGQPGPRAGGRPAKAL